MRKESRGQSVHSGLGSKGGPVSRFQAPPPAADSGSTHQREGGGDHGGGAWGLGPGAHAHARLPRPHPSAPRAARPRSNPGGRLAGPLPSPLSPELRTGAGSAPALLLASGKPRRSGSSSSSPALVPRCRRLREEIPPAHLRDAQGEKRSEPGLVREAGADAHLSAALGRGLYIGPQRKPIGLREET